MQKTSDLFVSRSSYAGMVNFTWDRVIKKEGFSAKNKPKKIF